MTDRAPHPDLYDVNADLYDAVSLPLWAGLTSRLAELLEPLTTAAGTVVDVGAGTGLATMVLARSAPVCPVVAVEPSARLRVGLMARVVDDPDLRSRVTVLPTDWAGALTSMPAELSGLTALNMTGHLDPDSRRDLWRLLAQRLSPVGMAVIGLQAPAEPSVVRQQDFGGADVGRLHYSGSGRAEPLGPDQVTWHMQWAVLDGVEVVEERSASTTWWTVSPATLEREAGNAGLRCRAGDAALGLYVLTRA